MTGRNRFADVLGDETPRTPETPAPQPAPAAPLPTPAPGPREEERTLSARVPDSIFREFQRHSTDAELELGVRKVTKEVGLEALVRLLRDPEVRAAWQREVLAVRARER